jgi:undecaprenyl-diphosphatase
VDLFQIIVLAIVQGLTEFLPISSSAHLILPKEVLAWPDQGLAFDVAVHVGTLLAVLAYFRKDLTTMTIGWVRSISHNEHGVDSRQAWYLILATIPICIGGFLMADMIENHLRSMLVIAVTTTFFGVLLGYADNQALKLKHHNAVTWRIALFVGCAQILALIPGTSRSGITMTAGLLVGLNRIAAARFSFLLSIPAILASGAYKSLDLFGTNAELPWQDILLGVVLSAVTAYLCVHWFLVLIEKIGMMPFVIYRLALGLVLFALVFSGT